MTPSRLTLRPISAGGIVYRRRNDVVEVVLVRTHRAGRDRWVLPKGLVGDSETLPAAAQREVQEETGLLAQVESAFAPVDLYYYWPPGQRQTRVHKTVHYYLMRFISGDTRDHDQEVEEAAWFPLTEAIDRATYPSDRRLLKEAGMRLGIQFASGGQTGDAQ